MASRSASLAPARVRSLPLAATAASVLTWLALVVTASTSAGSRLDDASMTVGSTVGSTLEFLCAWELMVVAMMLPSSLGFLKLVQTATGASRFPVVRRAAVCIGYALVWAVVGWVAMTVSGTLYRISDLGAWLGDHPNFLAGSVLVLAGGFQFAALKRRCLTVCSHPANFLMRHYRRGVGNALVLGVRYGLVCLGCCWALMAVMVVVGGGNLYLMMVLSAIMFAERMMGWDDRFASTVGLGLIALGVVVLASPDVMPVFAQGAGKWIAMESLKLGHQHDWLFWCRA